MDGQRQKPRRIVMLDPHESLGIIAGTGDIPYRLIENCVSVGRPFLIIAYHGHTDPELIKGHPHAWLNLGQVSAAFDLLHKHQIRHLVLAGGGLKARPSWRQIGLDKAGMKLFMRLGMHWKGDNKVLVIISQFLEENGFILHGPQDFLPPLLASEGFWTKARPDTAGYQDIETATHILEILSPLDFGQGIAIQNGFILGVEAAEGTDACIRRCGQYIRHNEPAPIYVKRAKKGQDERCDLPTIGPQTISALIESGFQGLCFQAGKTLVLSRDLVEKRCEEKGLFLWAKP